MNKYGNLVILVDFTFNSVLSFGGLSRRSAREVKMVQELITRQKGLQKGVENTGCLYQTRQVNNGTRLSSVRQ